MEELVVLTVYLTKSGELIPTFNEELTKNTPLAQRVKLIKAITDGIAEPLEEAITIAKFNK